MQHALLFWKHYAIITIITVTMTMTKSSLLIVFLNRVYLSCCMFLQQNVMSLHPVFPHYSQTHGYATAMNINPLIYYMH